MKLLPGLVGLIAVSLFTGCHRLKPAEEARLTAIEIRTYERRALEGDAEAARRLGDYYSEVEKDPNQAGRWKRLYETLHRQKQSSSEP